MVVVIVGAGIVIGGIATIYYARHRYNRAGEIANRPNTPENNAAFEQEMSRASQYENAGYIITGIGFVVIVSAVAYVGFPAIRAFFTGSAPVRYTWRWGDIRGINGEWQREVGRAIWRNVRRPPGF